jgi:tRNA nucleotidyltransferase/poly(A) polymerase
MTRITRLEVITDTGRDYVCWEEDNDITVSYQDDGRTLKVFVNTVKPKTGEEGALEALEKFQNDWLLGKKCPETKLEIKNLNSVESIKAEIKLLQSKLEFYEELEKQPLTLFDVIRNLGYSVDMCYEIVDAVEEFQKPKEPEKEQQIKELVKESVKWCEEHQNESLEDYLRPKHQSKQRNHSKRHL